MPYRSGAISSTVIRDTVAEESNDSAIVDEPSPGSTVPITAVTTESENDHQVTQWATGYSDDRDPADPAGYLPSAIDTGAAAEITTEAGSSSRRTSRSAPLSKVSSQASSKRPSQNLWARSRSFAGSYVKPPAPAEKGRLGASCEVRRSSNVAPPLGATGQENARQTTRDKVQGDRRRDSVNMAPSSTSASQAGSRAGSFSNPLRKGFSHQEGLRRGSESMNHTRLGQRGSISEYIKPTTGTEKGQRRSSGTAKSNARLLENASLAPGSAMPALEKTYSVPSSYRFKPPVTWTPAFDSMKTAPSGRPSPHTSIAEDPSGESNNKAQPSFWVQDKPGHRAGVYFRSRRTKDRNPDHFWLRQRKDPREKWLTIIPLIGIMLGFGIAGVYIFLGIHNVPVHKYCMVYEESFLSGNLDPNIWTKEVQVGGYGNGQFEETTGTDENVFIKDNILQIQPTLQDVALLTSNHTLNLTKLGLCTSDEWYNCVATTNTTNGTIINPVKSGRINTKKGANIKYGRIEVEAKMPQGDWIWPAIWMLPKDSVYGAWPRSGEIDIAESRGNNWTYPTGGNDIMSSALHWGPDSTNDAWWRTDHKQAALHSTFSDRFHTYGLEWSEKYLYTYLNGRLLQVLYNKFSTPFWKRGHFPFMYANGTAIVNPWGGTGNAATPFDQDFYLLLNVAVGGTNGWFTDGEADKPWVDASPTAKRDFWAARDQWYPTWQNENGAAMQVKSIKMWQQQGYNGCGSEAKSI